MKYDSIHGIYDTLKEGFVINKSTEGSGISIHNICARGSYIFGANWTSNDIVPMLRVYIDTIHHLDEVGNQIKNQLVEMLIKVDDSIPSLPNSHCSKKLQQT